MFKHHISSLDKAPKNARGEPIGDTCLTINHSEAAVGLMNLLDLESHEIVEDRQTTTHVLTFINGETVHIVADGRTVTVIGNRIAFHPSEIHPFSTLLAQPNPPKKWG